VRYGTRMSELTSPTAVDAVGWPPAGRGFRSRAGWHLASVASMHAVSDALFAGVYPLLPLIASDLHLSYGQVGAVKAILGGASALLQVPAGMLAETVGEHLLLAAGTGAVGLGLIAMAATATFIPLLIWTALAGIGGNTQHPVANALVSRLFGDARRPQAIGTLNFAGDIGKIAAPFIGGLGAYYYGWRGGVIALGITGLVFAMVYALAVPVTRGSVAQAMRDQFAASTPGAVTRHTLSIWHRDSWRIRAWGIRNPGAYGALTATGMLDAAARGAALALLPFVFDRASLTPAEISVAFAVLFGAGAAGKFLCGPLATRAGPTVTIMVTEIVTASGLILIPFAPKAAILWAILPFGFSLNGTSSVLYGLVAPFVDPDQRGRAYGLFYTSTLLATASAPVIYGAIADIVGLTGSFAILGMITLAIVPLAHRWRRAFDGADHQAVNT